MTLKQNMIAVQWKKLHPAAVVPTYETPGAAGMDLRSVEDGILKPGERKLVPTGLALAIPEGFEMQVRPRSGLALKSGITVVNAPGTVDSDYRGAVGVILLNTSDVTFIYSAGDRIAQAVFAPVAKVFESELVDELPPTARGEGGFGSTGK